jgi:DNA-binding NarL/FixJ family response regulator
MPAVPLPESSVPSDRIIRIIVVEDDARLLESLARLLEKRADFHVTATHTSAEEALAANRWNEGDVLISDIDLPGISSVELIAKAKAANPELLPLAYTIYEDRDTVFAALNAGAFGYLLKGCSAEYLETSIRDLVRGGAPMSPAVARRLLDRFLQDSPPEPAEALSPREVELLRCVAEGLLYKEIGEQLGISPHTVHTHIKNIYGKLHATDRQHALRRARMLGYLGEPADPPVEPPLNT